MTALPQQRTFDQYTADGVATVYIYSFYIPLDGDIQVFITPEGQTPSPEADLQVLGVDYTVQGSGSPTFLGGTITFVVPPPNGSIVTLVRNVENEIDTEYSQARNIIGSNLDNSFDRLMLCIQQNTTNFNIYGLQYIVNDLVPDASSEPMGQFNYSNQVPRLPNDYIWVGQNGGIVAALLEQNPDWSTLRTQLLSEGVGTSGTTLIGYNDPNNSDAPIRLDAFLDNLPTYINDQKGRNYGSGGGTANAITVTISSPFSLTPGQSLIVNVANANTDATTLTVTSNYYDPPVTFTTKNVFVKAPFGKQACKGGELIPGIYEFIYDGTQFELMDPAAVPQLAADISMNVSQSGIDGDSVPVLVEMNLIEYDPYGLYNGAGGSNLFTTPKKGRYWIGAQLFCGANGSHPGSVVLDLYVDGAFVKRIDEKFVDNADVVLSGGEYFNLTAGREVQIYFANGTGVGNTMTIGGGDARTNRFQINYIGAY